MSALALLIHKHCLGFPAIAWYARQQRFTAIGRAVTVRRLSPLYARVAVRGPTALHEVVMHTTPCI